MIQKQLTVLHSLPRLVAVGLHGFVLESIPDLRSTVTRYTRCPTCWYHEHGGGGGGGGVWERAQVQGILPSLAELILSTGVAAIITLGQLVVSCLKHPHGCMLLAKTFFPPSVRSSVT